MSTMSTGQIQRRLDLVSKQKLAFKNKLTEQEKEAFDRLLVEEKALEKQLEAEKTWGVYLREKSRPYVDAVEIVVPVPGTISKIIKVVDMVRRGLLTFCGALAEPISFIGTGVASLFEGGRILLDKSIKQRKTRLGTVAATIALSAFAAIVGFGVIALAPITLPLLYIATTGIAIYKEEYVLRQTRVAIEKIKQHILKLEDDIQQEKNPMHVQELSFALTQQRQQQEKLEINLKHAEIKRYIRVASTIGVGLIFAGFLFPPLLIAGLALLVASGIARVIQKANQKNDLNNLRNKFRTTTAAQAVAEEQETIKNSPRLTPDKKNKIQAHIRIVTDSAEQEAKSPVAKPDSPISPTSSYSPGSPRSGRGSR